MAKPKLKVVKHYTFTDNTFMPKEVFKHNDIIYVGGQHTVFEEDEISWDTDNRGAWRGPGPIYVVPKDLNIIGAAVEDYNGDPLARVTLSDSSSSSASSESSGSASTYPVVAEWGLFNYAAIVNATGVSAGFTYVIYNAITGQEVYRGTTNTYSSNTTESPSTRTEPIYLEEGSYVFWVHVSNIVPQFRLPPDYQSVSGKNPDSNLEFQYDENGTTWYYDPYYNVGRLPSDFNHELRQLRETLVEQNTTKDIPRWATYLIGANAQGGEWSALRFSVGEAAWEQSENTSPSPGPALYKIDYGESTSSGSSDSSISDETEPNKIATQVPFDTLARSVSASINLTVEQPLKDGSVLPVGTTLFGGRRATVTGPNMALWAFLPDGTIKILGQNENESTGYCECALEDHGPTDLLEKKENIYQSNGSIVQKTIIYLLSKCSLHTFNAYGHRLLDRLPGSPESTDGHPGGQALRSVGDQIYFFSEGSFEGGVGVSFYNYMAVQRGEGRIHANGTYYHGSNCAETWNEVLWGIQQDSAFGNPDALQHITWFDGAKWALYNDGTASSFLTFSAEEYNWQRLRVCRDQLFVFGKERWTEKGICGVGDGTYFQFLNFPYRVRRLTRANENTDIESLLCLGRHQDDIPEGTSLSDFETARYIPWQIIEINGETEKVVADCSHQSDDTCLMFCMQMEELESAGIDPTDLPPYLIWSGTTWLGSNNPPSDYSFYMTRVINDDSVCYIVPPRICFDEECQCFCISLEDIDFYDIDAEDLAPYLVWDGSCWIPTDFEPDLVEGKPEFLVRHDEVGKICYYLGEGVVDFPYDPVGEPALECIVIGGDGPWCPILNPPDDRPPGPCWDETADAFKITRDDLDDYFGVTDPEDLPPFLIWDGECWAQSNIEPVIPADPDRPTPYLSRFIGERYVYYKVGTNVLMPYNPMLEGEPCDCAGACSCLAIAEGSNPWCPTCPTVCDAIEFDILQWKFVRGRVDEDGNFVPCECFNAAQCHEVFPEGTVFRTIIMSADQHISSIQVCDVTEGQVLDADRTQYKTLWAWIDPPESAVPAQDPGSEETPWATVEEQYDFLENFTVELYYNRIQQLRKKARERIAIVILVIPESIPTFEDPVIIRRG